MTPTPTPAQTAAADRRPPDARPAAATEKPRDGVALRDLQRAALNDLVVLLTESAAKEAEIEQRHRQALADGEQGYRRASRELDQWHTAEQRTLRQKYDAQVLAVEGTFESERDRVTATHQGKLQQIQYELDRADSTIVQELRQAVWLAESVFDVTQNQIRQESKKKRDDVRAKLAELAEVTKRAEARCADYGQPMPPPEEGETPTTAPDEGLPSGAAASDFGEFSRAAVADPSPIGDDGAAFEARCEDVAHQLRAIRSMPLPRFFSGATPWLALVFLVAVSAIVAHLFTASRTPGANPLDLSKLDLPTVGLAAAAMLILGGAAFAALRAVARRQVREAGAAFRRAVADAKRSARARMRRIADDERAAVAAAESKRDREVQQQKARHTPRRQRAQQKHDETVAAAEAEFREKIAAIEQARESQRQEADAEYARAKGELEARYARDAQALRENHETQAREIQRHYEEGRHALERRWHERLSQIRAPIGSDGGGNGAAAAGRSPDDWGNPAWKDWRPPRSFAPLVRFGELAIDLKPFAAGAPATGNGSPSGSDDPSAPPLAEPRPPFRLPLPPPFSVPATLAFPQGASLLIQTDRSGRDLAVRTLQMVMTRLLTALPAGRARFTIIDPVGLGQNFAGFMHLADWDEALVGSRIHTDAEQIEQRLRDLTDHMETVIQKYLRNEFETIDQYNAQAGELAEPYRFLVIADFPANFSPEAIRRLSAIASTGARCGVYTLIARDVRLPVPTGAHLDDIEAHSVNLVQRGDRLVWKDDVFGMFPLAVDAPPGEETFTRLLHVVGKAAKEANRVEVPFETIAPASPTQFWGRSATEELVVPIGRMGATRLQTLRLGRGVAQHALIAGKTGSGKSTLLHVLVTNLAAWYSPDEVEFYLIDFKKGVEFKTYASHGLPHARAIAVESDREFGLSVLQRLDAELSRRGELYRRQGVQDLPGYRQAAKAAMPRTLLIIDEFQEFFSEDDKLAQEAALLLDRLVRQGRAFGIHVLLGSQTIGGSGLGRSTIGQMAIRVALQTSEADSQLILGDNNSAARLLSRPGEAIYNDTGGSVEGNSPFQVSWLPDETRERYLSRVTELARQRNRRDEPTIVFEGNAPADVTKNPRLAAALEGVQPVAAPSFAGAAPVAWLGEPVAIKDPTGVTLRRQSGANVLLVGQQDEAAMGILAAMMVSLAAQQPPGSASFVVLDGSPADSPLAGVMPAVKASVPHEVKLVQWRGVEEAVAELGEEVRRRSAGEQTGTPSVYLFVYGLQRYRSLRKGEEEFSFSTSDEEKKPSPGKQFADLLREGPPVGIHVVAWVDTPIAAERALDRGSMREFDHRILFQMSAADSSNLIDSPAANKLGFYRALSYSEEQGVMEKFRPYAPPGREWLEHVKQRLGTPPGLTRPDRPEAFSRPPS